MVTSLLFSLFMDSYSGDLFVDGKVIHRPQYRFTERQNNRPRPRPRYDRRRETMQVNRPVQGNTWASNQQAPAQQSSPVGEQSGGGSNSNPGQSHGNNA